jgi:hypothetical protein
MKTSHLTEMYCYDRERELISTFTALNILSSSLHGLGESPVPASSIVVSPSSSWSTYVSFVKRIIYHVILLNIKYVFALIRAFLLIYARS